MRAEALWRYPFADRSAIITGASSGIGRETAVTIAALGARVALLARREAELNLIADEIARSGGVALPLPCDVTQSARLDSAVHRIAEEFGRIDILVNSAGVALPDRVLDARIEDLRQMMDVNYFGAIHAIRAVLPIMLHAGRGNIVNIGSTAGRRGDETLAGYCASKFALVGYTEALRLELFGSSVTASLVMPGPVDTQMLENPQWQSRARMLGGAVIPASWVASAVIAAIVCGLAEVDVPPGAGTALKLAALFPDLTEPWYALGTRMLELFNFWSDTAPRGRGYRR
jgi:NADP-dependent 3-hydroxy acid dehydrogenase YdfG